MKTKKPKTSKSNFFRSFFRNVTKKMTLKPELDHLGQLWNALRFWVVKFKQIQLDPSQQNFWLTSKLDWIQDVDFKGGLTASGSLKLQKWSQRDLQKLPLFKVDLWKNLLIQELKARWAKNIPILQKIHDLNTPYFQSDFKVWTKLDFSQDLDEKFHLTSVCIDNLLKNSNLGKLKTIFNFDSNFLIRNLLTICNDIWERHRVLIINMNQNGFNLQNFVLWKEAKLSLNFFQKNDFHFLPHLTEELFLQKLNLAAFNKINTKTLHEFIYQNFISHWKNLQDKILWMKQLQLSLNDDADFNKTGFDWENDWNEKGVFKNSALNKIQFIISDQWKITQKINATFLNKFVLQQIFLNWKKVQPFVIKMVNYKSGFFTTKDWKKFKLNHNKLVNGALSEKLFVDNLHRFSVSYLNLFLTLDTTVFSDYLQQEINQHWQNICFVLTKILVFDKEALLQLPVWKATGINYKTDLQRENSQLVDKTIVRLANFSSEQLTAIVSLTTDYLNKLIISLVIEAWKKVTPVFKEFKKKNLDISDQRFWISTNLNWHNDLKIDGSLSPQAITSLPFKTINQLLAIQRLDTEDLKNFLENILSEKSVVKKSPKKASLWTKLTQFFFHKEKYFSLQERLENKIDITDSKFQQPIHNAKEFKKNHNIYQNLKKIYSNRIIHDKKIVTIYPEPIQPTRYIVEARNISKFVLSDKLLTPILKNLTFKLLKGDFVVIVGSSGAGKSTLLNVISGIDFVNTGDLLVDGVNVTLLNESCLTEFRRQYVGFVFQNYNLLQSLTGLENVEIGEALLPKFKQPMDMREIFRFLQIDNLLHKYPFQLSGGQQQRFSIARALAKNPDLLFCDEPTGALDQSMSKKVMEVLFEVNKKYGTTIILVTHNSSFVKLADMVIHVENGEISESYRNQNPIHPSLIDFALPKKN